MGHLLRLVRWAGRRLTGRPGRGKVYVTLVTAVVSVSSRPVLTIWGHCLLCQWLEEFRRVPHYPRYYRGLGAPGAGGLDHVWGPTCPTRGLLEPTVAVPIDWEGGGGGGVSTGRRGPRIGKSQWKKFKFEFVSDFEPVLSCSIGDLITSVMLSYPQQGPFQSGLISEISWRPWPHGLL